MPTRTSQRLANMIRTATRGPTGVVKLRSRALGGRKIGRKYAKRETCRGKEKKECNNKKKDNESNRKEIEKSHRIGKSINIDFCIRGKVSCSRYVKLTEGNKVNRIFCEDNSWKPGIN